MRILLVQPPSLGAAVHALPVMHDVRAAHPEATIDVLATHALAPLYRRVDGIAAVVDAPARRWRERLWSSRARSEWTSFARRLRDTPYDAIVDLQSTLHSAMLARSARGRRYCHAHDDEGGRVPFAARWFTHRAVALPTRMHAVDRARELTARALRYAVYGLPDYGLKGRLPPTPQPTVVFVHGGAREELQWPEARWVALGRRFVDAGWRVALPQHGEFEQVRAERLAAAIDSEVTAFGRERESAEPVVHVWPRLALDAVVDRLGAAHGAIGVDGGLSHVSVALGLPHVQLYLRPSAWRTGPQRAHGHLRQRAIGGETVPSVDDVWSAWQSLRDAS